MLKMITKTIDNRSKILESINNKVGNFSIQEFNEVEILNEDQVLIEDFFNKWLNNFPEEIKNPTIWNENVINNFYKFYDDSKELPNSLKSYSNWLVFLLSNNSFQIHDLIKLNKLLNGKKIHVKITYEDIKNCLFGIFGFNKKMGFNYLPILIKNLLKFEFATVAVEELIDKLKEVDYFVDMVNSLTNTIANIPELTFFTVYDVKNEKINFISNLEKLNKSSFIFIEKFDFAYNKINNTFLGLNVNLLELIRFIISSKNNNFEDVIMESTYKVLKKFFNKWLEAVNSYVLMDDMATKNFLEEGKFPVDLASNSQLEFFLKENLIFNFLNFYSQSSLTAKEILKERLRKVIYELD